MTAFFSKFPTLSLRKKLLFSFLILVLLPLSAVSLTSYHVFRNSLYDHISTTTSEVLRQTIDNIDNYISQLEALTQKPYYEKQLLDILEGLRSGVPLRNKEYFFNNASYSYSSYVDNVLRQMISLRGDTEGVFLYPVSGQPFVVSRNSAMNPGFKPLEAPWYKNAVINEGRMTLTPRHIQEQIGYNPGYVFSVSRMINSFEKQQPLAVISIDFNFDRLLAIRDNVQLYPEGKLGIYTMDGQAVLSGGDEQDRLVHTYLNTPGEATRTAEGYWMAARASAYSGWLVFYQVPIEVLNKEIDKIKLYILIIAVCALLLASIFYGWIVLRLTGPVLTLWKMQNQVGAGDLMLKMPQDQRKDEIGQLTAHFVKVTQRLRETIEETHVLALKRKQAQLDSLRMQVNPHFLYNTLESIYMMAIMNEDEETAQMIGYLGDFFKMTLRHQSELIPLHEEIHGFQVYWELQKIRFANRIEVQLDIPEAVMDACVVPLIFQPLVENAVQHGFNGAAMKIAIRVMAHQGQLIIQIRDNGKGLSAERLLEVREWLQFEQAEQGLQAKQLRRQEEERKSSHTGLRNVQERVRLLCGESYGLQVEGTPGGGFQVVVHLPLRLCKEKEASEHASDCCSG
ncbi:sensor histidine kinase [Paenibacillus sp. GCM10027626]|uniref:sensor histidine kinase n=1 Tax=Paenibacillus sp. GCM10027626 TaxID=3273411 RepID=UPI00362CFA38